MARRTQIKQLRISSNAYMAKLSTTDKIKVTATWMNIDNIKVENETMLTVTAMQFNLK